MAPWYHFSPPSGLPACLQVLGLVGSNGTGKSTALKVLAGKLKPNLGRFDVSGWVCMSVWGAGGLATMCQLQLSRRHGRMHAVCVVRACVGASLACTMPDATISNAYPEDDCAHVHHSKT
jgi:hypothetical protein